MDEKDFNPHVRFFNRRCLTTSYTNPVLAFDFRMIYVLRGSLRAELTDGSVGMEVGALLTVPPGVAYRLVVGEERAEIYILNFDFDSAQTNAPARAPVGLEEFVAENIFSQSSIPPFETAFFLPGAYTLEPILRQMEETEGADEGSIRRMRSGLLKYLLAKAVYLHASPRRRERDPRIQAVKDYVKLHYAQEINNKTVAMEMGYHPNYIAACFLRSEGTTLHAYIESVRLARAKELLTTTQMPIGEIAQSCGLAEASYFVKFFSRHTGMTPKQYRGLSM